MNKNRNTNELTAELKRVLTKLFAEHPAVLSAYLFGSAAQGFARVTSDIDVAIRVDEALPPETRFALRIRLIQDLERHFGKKVDIVVLNSASLRMINQVLTNGKLVLAADLEQELDYHVQKQKEFFDFKYYIDIDIKETERYFGLSNGNRS